VPRWTYLVVHQRVIITALVRGEQNVSHKESYRKGIADMQEK